MMEKMEMILEKLEKVVKDRKVIKVSILVCILISISIYVSTLIKLDPKPEYTTNELFEVAEEVVKGGLDLNVMKNHNYLITTEDGTISISKKDNSLAYLLEIQPKVIISFKEDGSYFISRNYFNEQEYNKEYALSVIAFTILFIIALTAILYLLEIVIAFFLYCLIIILNRLSNN